MGVVYAATPQTTYGTHSWTSITGSVTRDTTAARDPLGLSSWACNSGGANALAYPQKTTASSVYRLSVYFFFQHLPSSSVDIIYWGAGGAVTISSGGVLGLKTGETGSTLTTNTLYRISYVVNAGGEQKVFLNGAQDIYKASGGGPGTWPRAGWVGTAPGANKIVNISHFCVDDDTSLTDPVGTGYGLYVTSKLPAAVNNNQYLTTGGTGAVNERPLSETNYKAEEGKDAYLQDYTLQTAAVGDVDLTAAGITLIARSAWMWYNTSATKYPGSQSLVDNGGLVAVAETTTPSMFSYLTTSATYPSNAAGIGQKSTGTADDIFLYECGTLIIYKKQLVPPSGPTGVKTINDLAIASVKTIGDVAIASVKTIQG